MTTALLERTGSKLDTIDLSLVRDRMLVKHGWTPDRADAAIDVYKRFLAGVMAGKQLDVEADMDEIWHNHILFTQKYTTDCETLFGRYLHHVPHEKHAGPCACSSCSSKCSVL